MSARPRTTTSSVQRPALPRVATSRLFVKSARVFDAFFSMLHPLDCSSSGDNIVGHGVPPFAGRPT